jgi:hypothetical protein
VRPVASPAHEEVDSSVRGARLTINRVGRAFGQGAAVEAPPVVESVQAELPANFAPIDDKPASFAPTVIENKPRIVISRRNADDIVTVPLIDDGAPASASASI